MTFKNSYVYIPTLQELPQGSHKEAPLGKASCVPVAEKKEKNWLKDKIVLPVECHLLFIVGYILIFLIMFIDINIFLYSLFLRFAEYGSRIKLVIEFALTLATRQIPDAVHVLLYLSEI